MLVVAISTPSAQSKDKLVLKVFPGRTEKIGVVWKVAYPASIFGEENGIHLANVVILLKLALGPIFDVTQLIKSA